MQKKKEKLLDKIVKKDYNNKLEMILEKKSFDESAKNLLLSILYKIEASYKDYEKIKRNIMSKEEYIERFIHMIQENCDNITICKMNSEEGNILGDKTFLVDKDNKRIICYPIERKLLYCIAKISKNDEIIKKEYPIIGETLSNVINIGNNIETVEPLRDFNGYSWTTIHKEIESVSHNLIYQNLRILLGQEFLEKWIKNKEFIIDYMEILKNRLEEKYGEKNQKDILKEIEKLSVLLELKYNPKKKEELKREKIEIKATLKEMDDKEKYIEMLTKRKRELTQEIKRIDETVNDKVLLQEEYIKRNEKLPLKKKIFSVRVLSKLMQEERNEKLEELEKLNRLLNPKNFVSYKKETEQKYEYLKLVELEDLEKEIEDALIKLQKIFLKCYQLKITEVKGKNEVIDSIYEFRYYNLLPFSSKIDVSEVKGIKKELKETRRLLIEKAQELKIIIQTSKNKEIDDEILKNIFMIRMIALEDIHIKLIKEKEKQKDKDKGKVYLQLFDEEIFEEKVELKHFRNVNKKDLEIKFNKKIKVFN